MGRCGSGLVGTLITAIGAGHTAIGLVGYRSVVAAMAREGLVDSVRGVPRREEALWFLTSGAGLVVAGRLAAFAEQRTGTLPPSTGALLLGVGALGGAVLPRSGFWALIPVGAAALRVARRDPGATRPPYRSDPRG
jgi:Family of unknown function (DUF6463)